MIRRAHVPLHSGWVVSAAGGPASERPELRDVPATVPGCVHTDLLAAGLISDPFLDDNELTTSWVGRSDWRYRNDFTWAPAGHERVDLVCEGLDTVADLSMNGQALASTRNMHRSYRFDVTDRLQEGENTLEVAFQSAWTFAEAQREQLGERPGAYPTPYNFVRKMAASFGWDWGPTTVTAGVWRGIGLHAWSTARLHTVRPQVTVASAPDGTIGQVQVHVEVERSSAGHDALLVVHARLGGHEVSAPVPPGESTTTLTLAVPNPVLWWPRGHGEPVLHLLEVTLAARPRLEAASVPLDAWQRRVGFRTVELDRADDDEGSRFSLVVNGVPVLVKGANWIPDDAFLTRVDGERYRRRVRQAFDCGTNLLRVWGGGIYESEDFYDACDEIGLLVWQDFLFACAAYPEEEPLRSEVEAEARENVVRLMPHASLVLWNGNNENIWGWYDWDWQVPLAGRTWGEGYYLDLLPSLVAELDPTRPYVPASPYSRPGVHPNDDGHGPKHIWDVWNDRDYAAYRDYRPRFAAEFGWQAPPTYATLRRSVSDDPLTPSSQGVLHHQKAEDGNGKLARGLKHHFPEPATFDDWLFLTQVNQARAATTGIEHFRSLAPHCSGTVIWQLNDCWPVTSWAAIDGDGRLKPLWYALRRVHADRLLVVTPQTDGLQVALLNDTAVAWDRHLTLSRRRLDGRVLEELTCAVSVDPRGVTRVDVPAALAAPERPESEVLVVTTDDGVRGLWFFAEDREIDYAPGDLEVVTTTVGDEVCLHLTARTLVRDLVLQADRVHPDATVSDAMVTLLPGESVELVVRCPVPLDPDELVRAPVMCSVNDVVRRLTPVTEQVHRGPPATTLIARETQEREMQGHETVTTT